MACPTRRVTVSDRETHPPRPEADLPFDAPLEELVVRVLEDEPDTLREAADRLRSGVFAPEQDPPGGRSQQAVEVLHERGLA